MKKVYVSIILLWLNMALGFMYIEKTIDKIKSVTLQLTETQKEALRVDVREMIVTGYSTDRWSINVAYWRDGRTATNRRAMEGFCAADWNYYPPGTLIFVPGYGICEVQDKGGKIKGNDRLDLFFKSRREALRWGVKVVRVLVIHTGEGV